MAGRWEDNSAVLEESAARKRERALDWTEEDAPLGEEKKEGEEPPVKPKKKRNIFSDQHIVGARGFSYIYNKFPTHFNRGDAIEGNEAIALRDLISGYKEWAFELYPGLNFDDLIERTEVIAKKASVTALIQDLRQQERKRGEPEEEEFPLPSASEQWDAMRSHEGARNPSDSSTPAKVIPKTFRLEEDSEGETEFDVSGIQGSTRRVEDDDEGEAEFEIAPLKPVRQESKSTDQTQEKAQDDEAEALSVQERARLAEDEDEGEAEFEVEPVKPIQHEDQDKETAEDGQDTVRIDEHESVEEETQRIPDSDENEGIMHPNGNESAMDAEETAPRDEEFASTLATVLAENDDDDETQMDLPKE
ncbi:unnamed protein product [Aphanomyces euteiches]|uniref:Chromosome segregation in meiosis protein 3 domain-containing protein n=1 Tax=Aphanomyces euteiches TaxID=100861 RepID=A0A6G0WDC8_9STRA|nr:hypothetical protein Ae201684_016212 [Aphanomyces euteiches]KAH9095256.1 hypothetical protein Ae201684P_013372 [Aphanomyces euteiches]KAH9152122.1 hypothetical protein AeRB84_005400 [Aphanomyces euteiches]